MIRDQRDLHRQRVQVRRRRLQQRRHRRVDTIDDHPEPFVDRLLLIERPPRRPINLRRARLLKPLHHPLRPAKRREGFAPLPLPLDGGGQGGGEVGPRYFGKIALRGRRDNPARRVQALRHALEANGILFIDSGRVAGGVLPPRA